MVNKETRMTETGARNVAGGGGAAEEPGAVREKTFLLAGVESRVLEWIAVRLPARVLPDHLTALGVAAAVAIAAAYALSNESSLWLCAASALLVVHWLGDSLDGTLARVRRIERPKYGYYLDHLVDAIATALIGIGLGLSPHMLLATGLLIVIAYLVLSINTYLETSVFGTFSLGYGRVGPTEARIALVAVNAAMALGLGLGIDVLGVHATLLDAVGLAAAVAMLGGLGVRAAHNLRRLAEREPPATPRAA
jgi:archaetidylinositol phosphate synthase